jgi:hypothetical protein
MLGRLDNKTSPVLLSLRSSVGLAPRLPVDVTNGSLVLVSIEDVWCGMIGGRNTGGGGIDMITRVG